MPIGSCNPMCCDDGSLVHVVRHLTNYSINKNSANFGHSTDPDDEDRGSKWTLSAALRRLEHEGRDITRVMAEVEDLVIKTVQ